MFESLRPGARSGFLALGLLALTPATAHADQAPARRAGAQPTMASFSDSLQSLVARVSPAVVQVAVSGYAPATGPGLLARERGSGSGVILAQDGYIVTNAHVVRGASRMQVVLPARNEEDRSVLKSRGRVVGAVLVGADAETDLALLKIEEQGLPFLPLGDSEALQQGQVVLAFGSPFGLENSVSMGIVSAVARQLAPENPMIYVQTDAPINPGNSGGPLVDLEGRVVGINTLIFSQSGGNEGLGFAAPSNVVRTVYEQLKQGGRVRRGQIGARTQTVTETLAAGLKLPSLRGVLVSDVEPRGAAALAGLELGDLILSLDGKPLENARQFNVNVYARPPGASVELQVWRDGRTLRLVVPVVESPEDPGELRALVKPERNLVSRLGILGLDLDEALQKRLPRLRARAGVLVAAGTADAPYWQDPLQPGDVIYSVNSQSVTSVERLRAVLEPLQPGTPLALQVERRGELVYLGVELE